MSCKSFRFSQLTTKKTHKYQPTYMQGTQPFFCLIDMEMIEYLRFKYFRQNMK